MKIKTNHKWRTSIRWENLTKKERKDFDYLDTLEARCNAEFARYKGRVIHLNEMLCITPNGTPYGNWDGVTNDTYFSGVLIKYSSDCEYFKLATYFC